MYVSPNQAAGWELLMNRSYWSWEFPVEGPALKKSLCLLILPRSSRDKIRFKVWWGNKKVIILQFSTPLHHLSKLSSRLSSQLSSNGSDRRRWQQSGDLSRARLCIEQGSRWSAAQSLKLTAWLESQLCYLRAVELAASYFTPCASVFASVKKVCFL